MKQKKRFSELNKSEQENAINAMFDFRTKNTFRDLGGKILKIETVEEYESIIENGYNPDNNFYFYSNGSIDVKQNKADGLDD